MMKLPKFFLTLSLAAFATGMIACFGNVHWHPSWFVALPAGAIFFGLFLIAYVLQNETARFDEEAEARLDHASHSKAPRPLKRPPIRPGTALPARAAVE
jgi:hypothetical protein